MKYMVVRAKNTNRMYGLYKRDDGTIYEDKMTFQCLTAHSLTLLEAEAMLKDFITQSKEKRKDALSNLSEKKNWLIHYTKPRPFFIMKTHKIKAIL